MNFQAHAQAMAPQDIPAVQLQSPARPLYYAELTTRGASVGRTGELLEAQTRWVAFEDLATWPAALAANVDPRDVVRLRFPNDCSKRPAGVDVEVMVVGQVPCSDTQVDRPK